MTNFIIKTHRKDTLYTMPHLFILNKGLNSGKPQKEPFTNSFVIIFQQEEDCENFYFYSLQHVANKILAPIPYWLCSFLRLPDFKKEFNPRAKTIMEEYEQHQKNIVALKLLEQKEKQFQENLNLINDLRRVILQRYCNR